MFKEEQLVEKFKEVIESPEIEKLLVEVNNKIEKVLGDDNVDLFEIIEEGMRSYSEKSMFITDARIGKEGKVGYAVEFINNDGELDTDSAYFVNDEKVSIGMIDKIREMAYMGYVLRQGRDKKIVEAFKDMHVVDCRA